MNLAGHDIGVCGWSLMPKSIADLIAMLRQLNLSHVQLAVRPLLELPESARQAAVEELRAAGIQITAGMISFPGEDFSTLSRIRQTGGFLPDELWPERRERLAMAAVFCKMFGIRLLTAHVGFIPPSSGDNYRVMVDRVSEVAASLEKEGVWLGMETGQERAPALLQFINDLRVRNVAVNFDPANMLLYGAGDPIEAIETLGRHIHHVHIKDARESDMPGTNWGTEVPFGTGQVEVKALLDALHRVEYQGPLVIERESGTTRMQDVQLAIETLRSALAEEQASDQ